MKRVYIRTIIFIGISIFYCKNIFAQAGCVTILKLRKKLNYTSSSYELQKCEAKVILMKFITVEDDEKNVKQLKINKQKYDKLLSQIKEISKTGNTKPGTIPKDCRQVVEFAISFENYELDYTDYYENKDTRFERLSDLYRFYRKKSY